MPVEMQSTLFVPARRLLPRFGAVTAPRLIAAVALCGVVAVASDWLMVPPFAFQAHAVVGVADDGLGSVFGAAADLDAGSVLSAAVLARAAANLRDQGFAAAEPAYFERVAIAAGFRSATSQSDRIARVLATGITAAPGAAPGTLSIVASENIADRAASAATAVGDAFVAEKNEAASALRRTRDANDASRLQALSDAADAAHRRLAAFGAVAGDPAQDKANAAALTTRARARLDAFRAVMASGNPPLGAQTGLPSSIVPLQADYLELKRQLLDAQRTLGDKHTTVIGLVESMRQSAKVLTAEWKRLTQVAESEWAAARDQEAGLVKADGARDPKTRQALELARISVRGADEALARFQTGLAAGPVEAPRYKLIAPASVPTSEAGMPWPLRFALSGFAGLVVALLGMAAPWRAAPRTLDDAALDKGLGDGDDEPMEPHEPSFDTEPLVPRDIRSESGLEPTRHKTRPARAPSSAAAPQRPAARSPIAADRTIHIALKDVVADLQRLESDRGQLPTVFLGSLEPGAGTSALALAVARGAAEAGQRVLLIESARPRSSLAAAVPADVEPVVIDVLGALKIAMLDSSTDGMLYLAPAFTDEKRLAAALARGGAVPFVGDAALEFDLAIVDGGYVDTRTADDWFDVADATIRIGRVASRREDEMFLSMIGGTFANFIGTITASTSMPRTAAIKKKAPKPAAVVSGPTLAVNNTTVRPAASASRTSDAGLPQTERRRGSLKSSR